MVVTFPVGTYFAAPEGTSDMVALRDGMVLLTDDEPKDWTVAARRASHTDGSGVGRSARGRAR